MSRAVDLVMKGLRKAGLRRASRPAMVRRVTRMVVSRSVLLVWLWLAAVVAVIVSRHAPQTTTTE